MRRGNLKSSPLHVIAGLLNKQIADELHAALAHHQTASRLRDAETRRRLGRGTRLAGAKGGHRAGSPGGLQDWARDEMINKKPISEH